MTLWRSITPYDGFEEEIRTGKYHICGLTSTSSKYDNFFSHWGSDRIIRKDSGEILQPAYILKINVPKGTPVLKCNAYTKNLLGQKRYTRMPNEVVLPDCKARVTNIDNELNVIEMELMQ